MKKYIVWALLSSLFSFPAVALSYNQDAKDVWVNDLMLCESSGREVVILDVNDKYSYGVLQFQMGTWLTYGAPFGATESNIMDPQLQHEVARSMLDNGMEDSWYTCSKEVAAKYGPYPVNAPTVPGSG